MRGDDRLVAALEEYASTLRVREALHGCLSPVGIGGDCIDLVFAYATDVAPLRRTDSPPPVRADEPSAKRRRVAE